MESHRALKAKSNDLHQVPTSDDETVIDEMMKRVEKEEVELITQPCVKLEELWIMWGEQYI